MNPQACCRPGWPEGTFCRVLLRAAALPFPLCSQAASCLLCPYLPGAVSARSRVETSEQLWLPTQDLYKIKQQWLLEEGEKFSLVVTGKLLVFL